jgi:mRNA-degrading endonuclease RelE of RelBE toxin-antitoxin system
MSYVVIPTASFLKDVKYYEKKGFYNITDDIENDVVNEIKKGNLVGDKLTGMNLPKFYFIIKARARNSNRKVGKSNGYRIIYYAITDENVVYLLTVYSKKDDKRIPSDHEIKELVKLYCIK